MLDIFAVGTIREMAKKYGVPDAPAGCTHISIWRDGDRETVVYEKTSWKRSMVWDGYKWVNNEAHYQARRNLQGG